MDFLRVHQPESRHLNFVMAFFIPIHRNTIFIFVIIILLDNSVLEFMVGVTFTIFVTPIVLFC